jgi:hypothetical protein
MNPEGSLQRTQVPATGHYPTPGQSSPYHRTLFNMFSIYVYICLVGSFRPAFTPKPCNIPLLTRVRHAIPISSSFILSF